MSNCPVENPQCLPPTKAGATWVCEFAWRQPSGNPVDLTGYTAYLQIRTNDRRRKLLVEASSLNGLLSIDAAGGTVTASIPGDEMAIVAGQHALDVKVISPTDYVMATPTVLLPVLQHITEAVL